MGASRLLVEALRWLAGFWLLWSVPRCRDDGAAGEGDRGGPGDGPGEGPGEGGGGGLGLGHGGEEPALAVSVVIPARDEEDNLPTLLASLGQQQPPAAQVLVADDHSSDATADVARRFGATVVACPPLPDGWTGKSWACWTATAAATQPTLVFLDADIELAPGGLACVVGEHARRGGLASVQPFHRTERPYERLSAFFNVVSMMGVDAFNPLRHRRPPTGAFGPCLVSSANDYLGVGGHSAVRGEVVEDVALARRFVAAGLPVTCLGGRGTVTFRMYPSGAGQLVEGWTKNFATGAGATRPSTFLLVFAWLSGCISAAWYAVAAVLGRSSLTLAAGAAVYAAYAGQLHWMLRRIGRFGWSTPLLFPLPLACFLVVFTRSLALTHVRRGVRWRGRVVPTGNRARRQVG